MGESMELSYLYYFKVIAETENMSRAARELHVSQPALSKAVSKLESSLGVALFQRKKGRISLSPIGRDYYEHINRAFNCIDDGQKVIDEYRRRDNESVVIGSPVGDLLSSFIMDYMDGEGHEDIRITQFLYDPEILKEKLLDGSLDFALTPIPLANRDLEQTKLMDEEIFLMVNHEHRLAGRSTVKMAELKNEKFLVNEASFDLQIVTDHCLLGGFEPKVVLCSNETSIIFEALAQNRGVSLVPANVVYTRLQRRNSGPAPGAPGAPVAPAAPASVGPGGPIRAIRIEDVDVSRFISVAKRKDRMLSDNAKVLYRHAVKYYTDLGHKCSEYFDQMFPAVEATGRKSLYIKDGLEVEPIEPDKYGRIKNNRARG